MGQEFPSDYGLQAYYSCDTLPDIPDRAAGISYLQDAWATTDGWTGPGAETVAGGILTTTATSIGYLYTYKTGAWGTGKTIRLRVRKNSAVAMAINISGTVGGVTNTVIKGATALANGEWIIIDTYVAGNLTLLNVVLSSASTEIGATIDVDWCYIGDGSYTSPVVDNSGRGKHLAAYGVTPCAGVSGKGLLFDGINDYLAGDINQHTWTGAFTKSFWIQGKARAATQHLFTRDGGDTHNRGIRLSIDSNNRPLIGISGDGTSLVFLGGAAGSECTADCLLTFRFVPSVGLYIYKNGVLIASNTTGVIPALAFWSASQLVRYGCLTTVGFFDGWMDELCIYSRALSADEIFLLYTNIVRPVYSPIAPSVESSSTQASIFVVNSTSSGFALTSTIDNYENLLYERSFASIGKFQFSMLSDAPQAQYVTVNSYIIIAASYGQPQARIGIILSVDRGINSDHKKVLTVTGFEAKGVFSWRIFIPDSGGAYFAGSAAGNPSEVIFKYSASYQGGVNTADPFRKFNGLSEAANLGRGPKYILSERYTNVAAVFERLALASKMGWSVSWNGSALLFDVIIGKDRTLGNGINTPAILSTDFDTVRESHLVSDQTAYKSLVYVGGQGAGTSRVIQTRYTGSGIPSSIDRKEMFIDARDLNTTASLDSRGDEVLASVAYTSYATATVNPNSLFVKSSGASLGDYITVQSFGYQMTSQIVGITEQWGANGYEVEYTLDKKPNTFTAVISNEAGKLARLSTGIES